jgi:predicted DNA-binding transcriptional regulator AlpA
MTTKNLQSANDNWPLVLTRREAARMCGISASTFSIWIKKGILPPPIPGTRRWNRVAIEHGLAGGLTAAPSTNEDSVFDQWKRDHAA